MCTLVTQESLLPRRDLYICLKLPGKELCSVLPATHALTVCDTNNGLFKLRKHTTYAILQKHQDTLIQLTKFHCADKEAGLEAARRFFLLMYGNGIKGKLCNTLDKLHFQMATSTDKPVSSVPPTDDAFMQHTIKAKFQTIIWCSSHSRKPKTTGPTNYNGRKCNRDLHYVTS